MNIEAVVTIVLGLSALSRNKIGLKNIPPPIPIIPEIKPRNEPMIIEMRKIESNIIGKFVLASSNFFI